LAELSIGEAELIYNKANAFAIGNYHSRPNTLDSFYQTMPAG
jgi:hypothetical protein